MHDDKKEEQDYAQYTVNTLPVYMLRTQGYFLRARYPLNSFTVYICVNQNHNHVVSFKESHFTQTSYNFTMLAFFYQPFQMLLMSICNY
ncbi:hypothetical protein PDJAM_G00154000 [Pangasius djambal]|uniref:Uncharacterized protein n=1 Tax=Pangasius djambal TaxID=1691987 RepID=A0ACC5ZHI2_9TELE|nr:hypothetical protein [Pangasius djambal]